MVKPSVCCYRFLEKQQTMVLFVASVVALAGASTMIEMVYHLQLNQVLGPELKFAGVPLNAKGVGSWAGSAALLLAGAVLFEVARRRFVPLWSRIQGEIEREIGQREAAP